MSRNEKNTRLLRKFVGYYRPHRKLFFWDMVCAFFVAVINLCYPVITREVLNRWIPDGNIRMILVFCGCLLVIYLIKAGLNYFIQYYGHVVGVRMQADMRREIFARLQRLPFSFYDENKTGQIMSRIVTDLMDISELAHHGPEDLFLSALTLVGSFCLLCTINLPITLILFAFIPIIVIYSYRKRSKMSEAFTLSRKEVGEINANLENSISGIRVSKAFANQQAETEKFETSNNAFVKARKMAYRAMAAFFSGNNLIIDAMNVLLLVCGGLFIVWGQIQVADFLVYVLYINLLLDPIKRLVSFTEMLSNAMSGFRRFDELMQCAAEQEPENPVALTQVKGKIVFENVSFSYDEQKMVVRDLNLVVEAGRKVALVGPSGGGKTTLCHLIPRFYEIGAGSITIDGVDIRNVSRSGLRANIGIVQQDVFLFAGTIAENIAYGKPDATAQEIREAANRANIDEFISALSDGYDTYIGERGVKLSGGQKQRISIARVFLKNPPILILDEATSALDNFTEFAIQKALDLLCRDRTTLVVAHRLSTIKNADEIVVLDARGIRETGTHEELLARGGLYEKLYRLQFDAL